MEKKAKKLPNPVNYSLWLLNYKEKSVKEMYCALIKRGFDEDTANETVSSLLNWGYLNDERYKENLIARRKRNNPKGRKAVAYELSKAGIADIDDLEDIYTDEDEEKCICSLLESWERQAPLTAETRNRYYGRLMRRGFSQRNILHCLEKRRNETEIFS